MNRVRSPNYPSLSLKQAIDMVSKIHRANRTNVITRQDAAQAMGYTGLTGRSMTVIGALSQFGLISKAGKGDVKVSPLAVDILYAEGDQEKNEAMRKAAFTPQLFRDIRDRFSDGIPSENAIRSFLIKQEFSDSAVGPAINAFMATYREIEHLKDSVDSVRASSEAPDVAQINVEVKHPVATPAVSSSQPIGSTISPVFTSAAIEAAPELNQINMDIRGSTVFISGLFDSKGIKLLEKKIAALKTLLELNEEEVDDDQGQSL